MRFKLPKANLQKLDGLAKQLQVEDPDPTHQ